MVIAAFLVAIVAFLAAIDEQVLVRQCCQGLYLQALL